MTKFRNVITERQGLTFDSKAEADDWTMLTLRERAGEISRLQRQVSFELQPSFREGKRVVRAITHIVDFLYEEKDGTLVVQDCKGVETAVWKIKHKMFRFRYPKIRYVVSKVESRRRR